MKNTTLILIITLFTYSLTFSQSKNDQLSVEKSIFGAQIGLFGIFGYNESKLTNDIALRTEIGMLAGAWGGISYPSTGFVLTPTISLEPRYYYNLNRRTKKGKSILHNSANYFSIKTNYNPDLFVISNYNNLRVNEHITIVPKWGLRRNIGKKFDYEFSAGIGYAYDFDFERGESYLDLGLRIGYRF
jgi:hypothetical protein